MEPQSTPADGADHTHGHGRFLPSSGARALLAVSRSTFLGRGKARRVMGQIFGQLHHGPVDTELWGVPVRLYPDGNVSEKKALLCPAQFNRAELKAVAAHMSVPGSVFVDIGANAGLFSLFAARHASAGVTIVAFEPHPGLFERMSFNLRPEALGRAAGEVDIRLKNLALGASKGTVLLHSDADALGSGHIVEQSTAANSEFSVPMQSLQRALGGEKVDRISMMKIDVEGYEDQVLQPFFENASEALWPRKLIIEHLSRLDWNWDCIGECMLRGYTVTQLSRSNSLLSFGGGQR